MIKYQAEIWKDIFGYEGLYRVSSFSRVNSLQRISPQNHLIKEKILKLTKDKNGYLTTTLFKNGKPKIFKVHRLIAMAFISNPTNLPQVLHKNDVSNDNRIENLKWGTNLENRIDSMHNGGYDRKVTKEEIKIIRKMWESGRFMQKEIAKKFKISQNHTSSLVNNKSGKRGFL